MGRDCSSYLYPFIIKMEEEKSDITGNYKELVKKDLAELDKLVETLENKMKSLRRVTDEMIEVVNNENTLNAENTTEVKNDGENN